jgi:hypothetical protein
MSLKLKVPSKKMSFFRPMGQDDYCLRTIFRQDLNKIELEIMTSPCWFRSIYPKLPSPILLVIRASPQPPCWHRVRKSHRIVNPFFALPGLVFSPPVGTGCGKATGHNGHRWKSSFLPLFLGAETRTSKTEKKNEKNHNSKFFARDRKKKTEK